MNKLIHSVHVKVALMFVFLFTVFFVQPAETNAEDNLNLLVDAAILVDADTGKILYEKNAGKALGIASMTKMMTEYLLFEAIEKGTVKWDQKYNVTDYTYAISQNRVLSNVPLRRDGSYTIKELYEAMAIYSANAATIAIAETIAGTETQFVKMMNEKAEELGLEDYRFVNSTGLNNADLNGMHPEGTSAEDENVMSARSVAALGYYLLKDYPEVLETTKIRTKQWVEGTKMDNWNFMLPGAVFEYEGVDGLKTGTTNFAGHCFTGTAKKGDMRVIAVVMKAVDSKGVGSYKARFDATRALFDYGFSQFSKEELVPAGYILKKQKDLKVLKGKSEKVAIAVDKPIEMVIKTSEKDLYEASLTLNKTAEKGSIEAKVDKGMKVGTVTIKRTEGVDYGFVGKKNLTSNVVTLKSVERASAFSLMVQGIGHFFSNLFGGAGDFIKDLFS